MMFQRFTISLELEESMVILLHKTSSMLAQQYAFIPHFLEPDARC
jgi:hypothetical protein